MDSNVTTTVNEISARLFEDIAAWKSTLDGLGPFYDAMRGKLDSVDSLLKSAVDNATTITSNGYKLSNDMVLLLEELSLPEEPSPLRRRIYERRMQGLQRFCNEMVDDCHHNQQRFKDIGSQLKIISQELDEREASLAAEVRSSRAKKRSTITNGILFGLFCLTVAAVSVCTGNPAFISVAGQVVAEIGPVATCVVAGAAVTADIFVTKHYCDKYAERIKLLSGERNILHDISESIFMAVEGVAKIESWWKTARNDIVSLASVSAQSGLRWGPCRETSLSIADWEAIGNRFLEYSGGVREARPSYSSSNSESQTAAN